MEKIHVFISHITEEKETALCLKEFVRESLGWGLHIFVSSDYESIGGGDIWFTTIVDALKASPVEIVLLSPASVGRRWIDFEAGVGHRRRFGGDPRRSPRTGTEQRWTSAILAPNTVA